MTLSDFTYLLDAIVYLLLGFVLFYIGKVVYQLLHPSINVKEELVKKDNLAFSLAHVGYFVGLLIAIGSAIVGPSVSLWQDVIDISTYGGLAIVLLNISVFITDKVLLRKFSVQKEIIEDQNAGTGIIEGAVSIASGLVIFGAVTGEGQTSLVNGIVSALVFWALGQIALILTSRVYNMITPYDTHDEIEKDNVAVGIGFAGAIVAMGNLIRFGLYGDFVSWGETLSEAGLEVVAGLILLPIMRFVTDKILLPGENITDEIVNQEHPNIGAAIIEAFAYIGGSVLITWCL
ncbi:MAG: DUF350 domain-containing protein [Crocinitomicaceae bacterium]|nr:DUF350 domain-containing protein [Crocinitomicaceae bacterium]|tara:strand:+ start:299 stop:1168 length:870 start_codon:yes stop_codon:yes gene_type:complete